MAKSLQQLENERRQLREYISPKVEQLAGRIELYLDQPGILRAVDDSGDYLASIYPNNALYNEIASLTAQEFEQLVKALHLKYPDWYQLNLHYCEYKEGVFRKKIVDQHYLIYLDAEETRHHPSHGVAY